jgi:hypothetical protein
MLVMPARASDFDKHLLVVYFNPADREPIPGYRDRLDRVMTDLQDFFRTEMDRNGYGPVTFPLQRDEQGRLVVHMVQSDRSYARGEAVGWGDICGQVKEALAQRGIDMNQEYVITFQNLLFSDGDEIRGWMPYWGTGDHMHGHACVPDHALIDPVNLLKTEPVVNDAGRKRPLGEYAGVQLGGNAHKLGHAFGLPHNTETAEERKTLGTAVMGSGNYTYRRERTGQGLGTILTVAHARALSTHPLFTRSAKDRTVTPSCELEDVSFTPDGPRLKVSGHVKSTLPVVAVIAYLDPAKGRRDYDSRSWVAKFERDNRFEVVVSEFEPGGYELRLRFYHSNGAYKEFEYRYVVDESRTAPVEYLTRQDFYQKHVLPAYEAGDEAALRAGIARLEDTDDIWCRKARVLCGFLTQADELPVKLADVADNVREVWVGSIAWESATVGWGEPARNRRADSGYVLESGRDVHATGLYAHAPSRYVYRVGGQWKRLESGYGLQNWAPGTVVFVVKGDGKELFRSDVVQDWKEGHISVDIAGVDTLELIVEPTQDGTYADCSIWFSPRLTR